ncbi:DUF305 domain-containing protein [Actinoplanes sp. NPDC049548]|uniref:DUF305 domain-containing protein n=1 Tax=Actinoplanes sp. NPDC049548 TaxID=3155152 RepID=UPI0034484A31
MRALLGAGIIAVMIAAGCAGPAGDGRPAGTAVPAVAPNVPPSTEPTGDSPEQSVQTRAGDSGAAEADIRFAQTMILHHRRAAQLATLAQERSDDPEVQYMAKTIRVRQGPEMTTMTSWLTAWGRPVEGPAGTPPAGLVSAADLAELKRIDSARFDERFCTMMIAHHRAAVTLAEAELADGTSIAAKELAKRILTVHRSEIELLNGILAQL